MLSCVLDAFIVDLDRRPFFNDVWSKNGVHASSIPDRVLLAIYILRLYISQLSHFEPLLRLCELLADRPSAGIDCACILELMFM